MIPKVSLVIYWHERKVVLISSNNKKTNDILSKVLVGVAVSVGSAVINDIVQLVKGTHSSSIDISEWDRSYNSINKSIYNLDPDKYEKHRLPTTNKDSFDLCNDTLYFIGLKNKNYIKIESYKNQNKPTYQEQRLKISFFGKEKYKYRESFLKNSLKLSDEKHIRVQCLNEFGYSYETIPHAFDRIVLNSITKSNIINGLLNWKNSKQWYEKNELVHKIGLFLYGKPGTGKSTIAKAVSNIFDNAPILILDQSDISRSINGILNMRKRYDGTIIVLIEDFDMYFKSREEIENVELSIEQKKTKDNNQNALFQLLDGIYSTDNTIYIATTNYKDRIDSALIRHGRFDIQEELDYFDYNQALQCVESLGYDKYVLDDFDIQYPVQPSFLQSKVMEYRSKIFHSGT